MRTLTLMSCVCMQASHESLFDPPLPTAKLEAMQGLTTGVVNKVFLDFTGGPGGGSMPPAWGNPVVAYHLLWDKGWQEKIGDGHAAPAEVCAFLGCFCNQSQRCLIFGLNARGHAEGTPIWTHTSMSEEDWVACKTLLQGVPAWAGGIFSIRFGGSEFKAPAQAAHTNGHATSTNGHAAPTLNGHAAGVNGSSPQKNGKADAGSRLPTFTGRATEVYGNSSRESGWTAEQHAGAGLPASWAEHPAGAVLWITGGLLAG